MYSSGTTGLPKCMVHSAGGTLLQHLKEHLLRVDISRSDHRMFYFTTCGWMMWNWLRSALASGCGTLLPMTALHSCARSNVVFDFADAADMTILGTSAKFIDTLAKTGLKPVQTHKLERLRVMLSTGSPLPRKVSITFIKT